VQKYLAVEIEHTRYAKFLRIDEKDSRGLNLTTLVDDQRKAEVHIYLVGDGKKLLVHSFTVNNLPHQRAGEPRLYLSGKSDGRGGVHLSLKVNGKPWSSADLSLKKHLSHSRPWLFAGLGLLLFLFLLWLLLRSFMPGPGGQQPGAGTTGGETAVEETVESGGSKRTSEGTDKTVSPVAKSGEDGDGAPGKADEPAAEATTGAKTGETAPADVSTTTDSAEGEVAEETDTEEPSAPESERQPTAPPPENETVYFGPNSSLLTQTARDRLSSLADELASYPRLRITIRGHCALYGTEQGRIDLSNERAEAVEQYLLDRVEAFGHDPSGWTVESAGMGGKEPVTREEERQNMNRRVEIRIERSSS